MSMRLVQPDETMLAAIDAYRAAMLGAGSSMDGTGELRCLAAAEWLASTQAMSRPETCPPNRVTATQYVAVEEGRILGMIQLRHHFNDYLRAYGGHVGYSVHPDERGKGIATWMLRQLLPLARDHGIDCLLVTCDAINVASRRTIQRCGGIYERTALDPMDGMLLERYWIPT